MPDEIRGEEVKAYVLLVDGVTPDDLPPEEIVRHCAEHLAAFKVPRYLEYRTGDFPRTPSMKVQKQDLKAEKSDHTQGAWDRERADGPPPTLRRDTGGDAWNARRVTGDRRATS